MRIYLDNNATTPVAPEVRDAMIPFLTTDYFNPSSAYQPATGVAIAVKGARAAVASLLRARTDEILFTSCATESISTAILGTLAATPQRRHIITTKVEHPAVFEVCREVQKSSDVTFLPVDRSGRLNVREFVQALRSDTLLVSIMHGNNETGVLFPIEELARITKETDPKILFMTDATQTVGKIAIDLTKNFSNVDLLAFSGHKIHAPKGIGVLFVRRGTPMRPFLIGGHQESGRRAGTENVPYIIALGVATQLAADAIETSSARILRLRDKLESEILARIPFVEVNGGGASRLDNTLNLSVHFIEGEGILQELDSYEICASSGSACTSGSLEPSRVLTAMGVPFTAVHGSIRFSLSRYTTEDEVDRVIEVFPQIVTNLRKLSPYWDVVHDRPRPEAESMMHEGSDEPSMPRN